MVDVVLTTRDGRELKLRRVPKPEKKLQVLMNRLKRIVAEHLDKTIKM